MARIRELSFACISFIVVCTIFSVLSGRCVSSLSGSDTIRFEVIWQLVLSWTDLARCWTSNARRLSVPTGLGTWLMEQWDLTPDDLNDEKHSEPVCECRHQNDGLVPIRLKDDVIFPNDGSAAWAMRINMERSDSRDNPKFDPDADGAHLGRCVYCQAREDPQSWHQSLGELPMKNSFVDDYLIDSISGIERILEDPVFDEPIKANLTRHCGGPVSVNFDGKQFVMHKPSAWFREGYGFFVGYVEGVEVSTSLDGHSDWKSGVYSRHLKMSNSGEFCVTIDKWPQRPSEAWIMAYNCGVPRDELCVATSHDGFDWYDHGHKFGLATDSLPCIYHDCADCDYKLILRRNFATSKYWRDIRGTQVLTLDRLSWSRNLQRGGTVLENGNMLRKGPMMPWALTNSWYFDKFGKKEPYQRVPYYQSRPLYEGIYFGLLLVFEWRFLEQEQDRLKYFSMWKDASQYVDRSNGVVLPHDVLRAYLATSRDGVHYNFQWVYAQQPLRLGPEGIKSVLPGPSMITLGGYHWLYYTGSFHHHRNLCHHAAQETLYLAKFSQDRIVGLTPVRAAGTRHGIIVSKPFTWPSGTLAVILIVEMRERSSLRANICSPRIGSQCDELINISGAQPGEVCLVMGSVANKTYLQPEARFRFELEGDVKLFGFSLISSLPLPHICQSKRRSPLRLFRERRSRMTIPATFWGLLAVLFTMITILCFFCFLRGCGEHRKDGYAHVDQTPEEEHLTDRGENEIQGLSHD